MEWDETDTNTHEWRRDEEKIMCFKNKLRRILLKQ